MNQKRRNGPRAIAALLLFSIMQVSLQVGLAEPTNATTVTTIPQQFVAPGASRNDSQVNGGAGREVDP